jgi:hypothetical protein
MFVSSNKSSDCDYSGWASKNLGTPRHVRTSHAILTEFSTLALHVGRLCCARIDEFVPKEKNNNKYVSYICPYLRYLRYYIGSTGIADV